MRGLAERGLVMSEIVRRGKIRLSLCAVLLCRAVAILRKELRKAWNGTEGSAIGFRADPISPNFFARCGEVLRTAVIDSRLLKEGRGGGSGQLAVHPRLS